MGLNEDLKAKPACHPRAVKCAIQNCLTKNNYDEDKCQPVIMALYECCNAFYRAQGDDAVSASCPKPHLLHLKLKRLREESQSNK